MAFKTGFRCDIERLDDDNDDDDDDDSEVDDMYDCHHHHHLTTHSTHFKDLSVTEIILIETKTSRSVDGIDPR